MTFFILLLLLAAGVSSQPVLMEMTREPAFQSRPPLAAECRASSSHFCAGGRRDGSFPRWWATDTISLFALSKRSPQLSDTPIDNTQVTYALGLHSSNENKNYTLSYSPMSNYYDTVVPRMASGERLVWCNQAATCLQPNISTTAWDSIIPIGRVSGEHIAAFEVWVKYVNNSQPFQWPLLVTNSSKIHFWLAPLDSTVFFIRALVTLKNIRAVFRPITLNYTLFTATCDDRPLRLGNASEIRRKDSKLYQDIVDFYGDLQATSNIFTRLVHWASYKWKTRMEHKFYYFWYGAYWRIKIKSPYLKVISLPLSLR